MLERMRHASGLDRHLLVALAAVTLFLRLVVPPGYMPVAAGGGLTFAVCTGQGLVAAAATSGDHRPGFPDDPGSAPAHAPPAGPCVFSALGSVLDSPVLIAPAAVPLLLAAAAAAPLMPRAAPPPSLAAPPPPAHAPPRR